MCLKDNTSYQELQEKFDRAVKMAQRFIAKYHVYTRKANSCIDNANFWKNAAKGYLDRMDEMTLGQAEEIYEQQQQQ